MLGFLRENGRWVAGGFLLTFSSSFGQTFFVSASVAEWQAAFDLTHGEFGRLYMLATLGSALTLPFLGRIVDIVPEHRVIALCAPLLAGACLAAAFAPSLLVLTLAIYALRLFGQGMMTHIALTATGRWFAAQRGRAVSLVVLGHQGGEITLPLAFAALALALGFQAGWMMAAGFLVLVTLPLGFLAYRTPRHPHGTAPETPTDQHSWTRGEVMRDPVFWILLTGVLAPPFIGTTIFFHQDYLAALNDWPPTAFPGGLSLMAATTVIVALIMGQVIDKVGSRSILPFFLLPLAAACFVIAGGDRVGMLYGGMVLLGISYGVSSTLFGALWPEVYGPKHLGAVRSVIVAIMVFATAAGPGLTGTLIDGGLLLPRQLVAMGMYCLMIAAVMAAASGVLRRRATEQG